MSLIGNNKYKNGSLRNKNKNQTNKCGHYNLPVAIQVRLRSSASHRANSSGLDPPKQANLKERERCTENLAKWVWDA
jgi:hypothetical protein